MLIQEKIKLMRLFKGWSQEEMAEKLDISVNAYSKIERGETDINLSRLQQIADKLNIDLSELFNLNEKSIIHLTGLNYVNLNLNGQIHYHLPELVELEYRTKQLEQENSFLKEQIFDLKEIIKLINIKNEK